MNLGMNLSSKTLFLAAAAALAACSRNPQPNSDETGRADTTTVIDTTHKRVTPSVTPSVTPRDTARPVVPKDTTVNKPMPVRPDTSVRRDSSLVRDSMPYPRNTPTDTTKPPSP